MKHIIAAAGAALVGLAGCSSGQPQAVVTVTAEPSPDGSESPSFATPGTASDEEFVGFNCDDASKDAMKVSRKNNKGTGNPVLIAVIRIKGPTVDKSLNPPRNGRVYVCTGTGVWTTSGNSKIVFGYMRQGGQWFTFYDEA